MFLAIDRMRHVRTRALSPDKTISATMTSERGISVTIEYGSLTRHSVHSLAREVRAAVAGVMEGFHKAGEQVMSAKAEADALERAWKSDAGRRLRPFAAALDRITATGVGARGVAKVGTVEGRLRVAFRPEALQLRESELGAEIESALVSLQDHRSKEATRLYDELVATEEEET